MKKYFLKKEIRFFEKMDGRRIKMDIDFINDKMNFMMMIK